MALLTYAAFADDIEKYLDAHGFTFEMGPPMPYDQYGTEYTVVGLGGAARYGLRTTASTQALAASTYEKELMEFLGTRRHIIWRTRPEAEGHTRGNTKFEEWEVYSRLSAYPVKPE
jgi:hypothetical protein